MNQQKTVLITGAAKGIGRETASLFADKGHRLLLADIDAKGLNELKEELESKYHAEVCCVAGDLADENHLRDIVNIGISQWKQIDILVNNAAWRTLGTMRTMDWETWEKTLRVCLTAPAFLAKYVAEKMEASKTGGVIVNLSSMMSDRPAGNSPAYIAAKGGLESLTRELAVTYGRSGIRVVCVKPGYIDTDLSKDYQSTKGEDLNDLLASYLVEATPLRGPALPSTVAEAIYWLCSTHANFITGTSLTIDGGFSHNMNSYTMKNKQFPNEY